MPSRYDLLARVDSQIEVGPGCFRLDLFAPEIVQTAQPGQFCMLETGPEGGLDPLLRRPLSVHRIGANGILTFLYRRVGRGTALLARRRAGDLVRVLGPLGRGFRWSAGRRAILVGGGLGVAPLLFLAESLPANPPATIVLGARTPDDLPSLKQFSVLKHEVLLATENGDLGVKGLATDRLSAVLQRSGPAVILFACGPAAMLKVVSQLAADRDIPCQVSLETAMACGTGLCLGCAVPRADGNGYWHVCKEGPVVEAREIAWG